MSLNLLTLPVWWYTAGWNILWAWNKQQINFGLRQTGLMFFVRHLNEPLYGDYTRSGRFLGFLLRGFLLIAKSLLLLLRICLLLAVDLLFLMALPVILAVIIYQLAPH